VNVLIDPLVRVRFLDDATAVLTLPGVLAAMMLDHIASFPALRAHQRHAWHAFLVQLGAMALHRTGRADLPEDESTWRDLLRGLTPEDIADDAWTLVNTADRAALLQPPLPDGIGRLKNVIGTPDKLDILVTAKNHDLKQAIMLDAQPDDWLFALLTLQTMEGFLGAGNYGISRMNGGFANRPALGLAPPGGPGARVRRDLLRLIALRIETAARNGYASEDGISLVWTIPWDGANSLTPSQLDPWYIEICRRVRLVFNGTTLSARAGTSTVARIVPPLGGVTGDPWAPVVVDKDGSFKVLTMDARGFDYRRVVTLMFPDAGARHAPLQQPTDIDAKSDVVLIARALVRGQGKTEGYHERTVPISRELRQGMRWVATDRIARTAYDRVGIAGEMQRRVLRHALLALFENGPEKIDARNDAAGRKADVFLAGFDRTVDRDFFPDLWREIEAGDADAGRLERRAWVRKLLDLAEELVEAADRAAPKASHRRYRARVRAFGVLRGFARTNTVVGSYLMEDTHERVA
jgi:CRISPR system Cascade subunit CasA